MVNKYCQTICQQGKTTQEINSQQHIKQFVNKVKQYAAKSNNLTYAEVLPMLTNLKISQPKEEMTNLKF